MISTPRLPILAVLLCCAGLCPSQPAQAAEQMHKKTRANAAPPAGGTAPSRANDLNSPSTDFSDVAPVLEDPKAELLRPRKKKDANFD